MTPFRGGALPPQLARHYDGIRQCTPSPYPFRPLVAARAASRAAVGPARDSNWTPRLKNLVMLSIKPKEHPTATKV